MAILSSGLLPYFNGIARPFTKEISYRLGNRKCSHSRATLAATVPSFLTTMLSFL